MGIPKVQLPDRLQQGVRHPAIPHNVRPTVAGLQRSCQADSRLLNAVRLAGDRNLVRR